MSEEAPQPERVGMIGTSVGNYEIIAKLGEGGMGAVYLGRHPLIGKQVAIKVLLEELVSNEAIATRFFHEAKAANDIRHQNIVDVVDFGKMPKKDGGFVVYIMMEFLEGESLSSRLQKGLMPVAAAQHILTQCCSGLAASHAKGIIHRDLKPDNLFLIRRGGDESFLKILDFGIAKLTAVANTNAKTRTGTLIGTPAYMSPEQCSGRGNIDARSDIYSLGVVMYEMLTGTVPFVGEGFGDIVVAHITEAPRPPREIRPDLPAEWEQIVLRALEKEVDRRFQTMEEFGLALADPAAYAASPDAIARAGRVAASPTTSVPAVRDKSGPMAATAIASGIGNASGSVAAVGNASGSVAAVGNATGPVAVGGEQATVLGKKENTTLSAAASEVREPAKKGGRVAAIGAVAALAIAGAVGFVAFRGKDSPPPAPVVVAPAPTPAPAAAPPAPAKPEQIVIKLSSTPPGASVTRGNAPLGVTPLTMNVDKGAPKFDVALALDGYKAETRTIDTEYSSALEVALMKAEAPPAKKKRSVATTTTSETPAEKAPAKPSSDDEHKLLQPEL
jgi:eukaryotic-like serine/threonine-protein kinase